MLLVKRMQDIFTASKKHEKTCFGQRVQRARHAGIYCGLLRPKVKSKRDFLGHMMIVQTFMKEKKKGGRGMSYGKQQRKDSELCERRPPTISSRGTGLLSYWSDRCKNGQFSISRCISFCTGNIERGLLNSSIDAIFTSHQSPISHSWSSFYCPWWRFFRRIAI